jgi:hypothetical protein
MEVGFFSGNTGLSMELWNVLAGVSGFRGFAVSGFDD